MKRFIILIALSGFLSGCSWVQHNGPSHVSSTPVYQGGSDVSRGTTGVSTGADAGSFITGSDSARY